VSHPKIDAPGEAFNTVWYDEQMANAALSMNVSMSAGSTDSAMSISDCASDLMDALTYGIRLRILIVVGLCFLPYDLHNVSKCNLNSDPLSYIT
jgi:hypothetical protein